MPHPFGAVPESAPLGMDLDSADDEPPSPARRAASGWPPPGPWPPKGVRVAICGRDADRIEHAAASIDGDVVPIVADVATARRAPPPSSSRPPPRSGGVDILVANAGGPPPGTFAIHRPSTPTRAPCDLNLLSVGGHVPGRGAAMQAPGLGAGGRHHVDLGAPADPDLILSNTARAGVTGFLKTLALEVAGDGVTVNSVLPGSHDTDRLRSLYGGDLVGAVAADTPVGAVGRPEDFGAVAAFLCSDQARFITGAAIPVDGGAYRALL